MRAPVPGRFHLLLTAAAFTAVAIYGSFVPFQFRWLEFQEAASRFRAIPMLQLDLTHRADWVANILLFIPLGFFWTAGFTVDRSRRAGALGGALVVPLCVLLAAGIEFLQLWAPPRTVSQNDVVAEGIGAAVGAILWVAVGQPVVGWLRGALAETNPRRQIDRLLEAYLVGLAIYSLLPLDLTLSPEKFHEKWKAGRVVLIPFSQSFASAWETVYQLGSDVALFVPVGALAATAYTPKTRPVRGLGVSIALVTLLAAGIAIGQLPVWSRSTDATDIVTGIVGGGLGAWWMRRWVLRGSQAIPASQQGRPRPRAWVPLGLAVLYAAGLAAVCWAPFQATSDSEQIRARLEGLMRMPFESLYWGTEFQAVSQTLSQLLQFAPLGALSVGFVHRLQATAKVRRIVLGVLWSGWAGWGLALELGQVLIPARVPDLTDVLVGGAGVALGMVLALRVERCLGRGAE